MRKFWITQVLPHLAPYFSPYATRFDALKPRERLLVLLAIMAGMALFGYAVLLEAPWSRQRAAQLQLLQQKAGLVTLQSQMVLMQTRVQNLGADERAQLEKLQQQAEQASQHLQALGLTLIAPDKMADFLAQMLKRGTGVQLLALRNLPVSELTMAKKVAPVVTKEVAPPVSVSPESKTETKIDEETITAATMFRHGVEITLAGSYADLLNYVSALEKMPQRVLWGSLKLAVDEYPRARMTLTVYTLSLDRTWLTL